MDTLTNAIQNAILGAAGAMFKSIGAGLAQFLVSTSYSVALIGGGILIILYVAGYKDGMRWTGILVVSHAIIRYLLG